MRETPLFQWGQYTITTSPPQRQFFNRIGRLQAVARARTAPPPFWLPGSAHEPTGPYAVGHGCSRQPPRRLPARDLHGPGLLRHLWPSGAPRPRPGAGRCERPTPSRPTTVLCVRLARDTDPNPLHGRRGISLPSGGAHWAYGCVTGAALSARATPRAAPGPGPSRALCVYRGPRPPRPRRVPGPRDFARPRTSGTTSTSRP